MALIVEDGTAKTDAESYVSVLDADAYITLFGGHAEWDAAGEEEREVALRIATRYLDSQYKKSWKGTRRTSEQALAWPRFNVIDEDGWSVADNIVPKALKDAASEMAKRHLEGDVLLPDLESAGIKEEEVKVGPIEERIEYTGSKPEVKRYDLVEQLLAGLLKATSGSAIGRIEKG